VLYNNVPTLDMKHPLTGAQSGEVEIVGISNWMPATLGEVEEEHGRERGQKINHANHSWGRWLDEANQLISWGSEQCRCWKRWLVN
jgi:hypothetical protein